MKQKHFNPGKRVLSCCRREFLFWMGAAVGAVALGPAQRIAALSSAEEAAGGKKKPAMVRGAFIYPSSEKLREPGAWWSWPGKDFDAEGRQRLYTETLKEIEKKLAIRISLDKEPLDTEETLARFIDGVKASKPDGLLLFPFHNFYFKYLDKILKEVEIPTVIYSCLGVKHGSVKKYQRPGVCFIQSLDNFDALAYAMQMLHTKKWMQQAQILSIVGAESREYAVPHMGTRVRILPLKRFVDEVDRTENTEAVKALARTYKENAKEIFEPAEPEIVTAARVHFAVKKILETEPGDAIMID